MCLFRSSNLAHIFVLSLISWPAAIQISLLSPPAFTPSVRAMPLFGAQKNAPQSRKSLNRLIRCQGYPLNHFFIVLREHIQKTATLHYFRLLWTPSLTAPGAKHIYKHLSNTHDIFQYHTIICLNYHCLSHLRARFTNVSASDGPLDCSSSMRVKTLNSWRGQVPSLGKLSRERGTSFP